MNFISLLLLSGKAAQCIIGKFPAMAIGYIQKGTYMQIHPLCMIGSSCGISESGT